MPGTELSRGNILYSWCIAPTLASSGGIGANTTTEVSYTIQGIQVNDIVDFYPLVAITGGISVGTIRVSAANTILIAYVNSTAATLSLTPGQCQMMVTRPELPLTLLPTTAA